MRITKLLFTLVAFIYFSSTATANVDPTSLTLREEIRLMVQKAELNNTEEVNVVVNFVVNNNHEIVIISTNDTTLDWEIRTVLNLKKVEAEDIEINKIYTLPIKVKRM